MTTTTPDIFTQIKTCTRRNYQWLARVPRPIKCPNPKCQAKDWDKERKK